MNELMSKLLGASWRTTLAALGAMACTGTDLAQLIPPRYSSHLHAVCTVLIALGLIAAKDKQVSNAPQPMATAQTITK